MSDIESLKRIAQRARDFQLDKTGIGFYELLEQALNAYFGAPKEPEPESPYFPKEGQ